jgi:hypothetical protein
MHNEDAKIGDLVVEHLPKKKKKKKGRKIKKKKQRKEKKRNDKIRMERVIIGAESRKRERKENRVDHICFLI